MEELIQSFPQQLIEAVEIGAQSALTQSDKEFKNIVVTGMGGSGIGGNLVAELVNGDLKIPLAVSKDYFIPSFTGNSTLVIVSSYSGNTEETIAAMQLAEKRNARVVCITTGGQILDYAIEKGFDYIKIPGGMPPRSCLGYSFVQQLMVLGHFGLISGRITNELKSAATFLIDEQDSIRQQAKEFAKLLLGKITVIYTTRGLESVAVRFRQQLNENAKTLCWHHVIPEMNHNELVGWRDSRPDLAVIFLRHEHEYPRTAQRISLNKELIANYTPAVYELWAKGNSLVERAFYLIHLTDYISCYLAQLRQVDPVEVEVIDRLKSALGDLN